MREIRLYGSEGGGAARSPYPYQRSSRYARRPVKEAWIPARASLGRNDEIRSALRANQQKSPLSQRAFSCFRTSSLVHSHR